MLMQCTTCFVAQLLSNILLAIATGQLHAQTEYMSPVSMPRQLRSHG